MQFDKTNEVEQKIISKFNNERETMAAITPVSHTIGSVCVATGSSTQGKQSIFEDLVVSESESILHSRNPYIICNEKGIEETLQKISQEPEKEHGVYLGFAFEFNYNVLVQRCVECAFICDIDGKLNQLYHWVEKTICQVKSSRDFLDLFRTMLSENSSFYFGIGWDGTEEVIDHFSKTEYGWLSSESKFTKIQSLYREGKIKHLNINLIKDCQTFEAIGAWMTKHHYTLDVLYISNIPEWIEGMQERERLRENIMNILCQDTILIDAKKIPDKGGGWPVQRVSKGIISEKDLPNFLPEPSHKRKRPKCSLEKKPINL